MATSSSSTSTTQLEIQLGEDDDLLLRAESGWEEARTSCNHLSSLSSDLLHIPSPDTPCNRCHDPSENWLCLCCKDVLCSWYVNKHMLQHFLQTNHSVALSYSNLSVWCFICNACLDAQVIPQLRSVHDNVYRLKIGRARPSRTVLTSIPPFRRLEIQHGEESGWVEAGTSCDHLASLSSDLVHIPTPDTPCNRCHDPSDNWLCLCCSDVLCSRYVNKHMLQHFQQTNHSVALSYSNLSVWCFACNAYLDAQVIPQLRSVRETVHMLKIAQARPSRTVRTSIPPFRWLEIQRGEDSGWVEARTSCDHLASLSSDLVHIPTPDTPCNRCHDPSENWLCLCCSDVLCSRYVNKHMLQHFQQTNHSVALSYSNLSVWCSACNAYLDAQVIPQLRSVCETVYMLKIAQARPSQTVRTSIPPFRWLEIQRGEDWSWVEARTSCDHLALPSSDLVHIPTPDTPCNRFDLNLSPASPGVSKGSEENTAESERPIALRKPVRECRSRPLCHDPSENWLCLCCSDVLCSRYVNKHMLQHFQQTNHSVALSYSNLSVWCFACNAYLDAQVIPQLRSVREMVYMLKIAQARPSRTVRTSIPPFRWLEIQRGEDSGWVEARTSCDHLASLSSDLVHIPTPDTPCNRCHDPSENWLCLCCSDVLCSRYVNKHMLQHFQQTNHSVALSYSNLSVWCSACNAYLDAQVIPQLRSVCETVYMLKIAQARPSRTVRTSIPPFRWLEIQHGEDSSWVEARTSCDHLASPSSDLEHIPTPDTPCNRCHDPSENWLCLCCSDVLCSRYVNKHMLQHFQQTNHSVALSYSNLSVWCFACNAYLDTQVIPQLRSVHETEIHRCADSSWVEARTSCDHLASLSSDLVHIPTSCGKTDGLAWPGPIGDGLSLLTGRA
ncbi:hypothetical protein EZV62_011144 [Acer yangbiense]|uniref:UBP-type domain-containing protein n=1 Tax=Acer yangbiense TaxID=1000413 RepID=A0A5C7I4H4_9ROSI|nr:hypothetical protein EZV62_011144 [Acer yangbiense]